MTSDLPKVLHSVGGKPIVSHVIDTVKEIPADRICVVVGYKAEMVEDACKETGVEFVLQEQQFGTGHAVLQCKKALENFEGTMIVLNGDVPALRSSTIRSFIGHHQALSASATVLTAMISDPTGYGRIVRDEGRALLKIVEEKDASPEIRKIREINSGLFCFEKSELFRALGEVNRDNVQNEYYLTDVIAVMKKNGLRVGAYCVEDCGEVAGVNTDEELESMRKHFEGTKL